MRFSVIVPVYNKAPYVEKALKSVLSQTFSDYELIVVNDGSTDNSLSVIRDTLFGVSSIIINQDNAGVSVARNRGVNSSSGEYLCFLDADDWWEPNFLERMNTFVDEYPEAQLFASNYYYVKNGKRLVKLNIPTGYINYCQVYSEHLCQPVWTGAVCLSRKMFDEYGGFKPNLTLGEDFDLWIRIALKYKVVFLNETLSNYNQDADIKYRGTRTLHHPENHMLWNLDDLAEEETYNPDYKRLIDKLRSCGLFPYYLSKWYQGDAEKQLLKINWNNISKEDKRKYATPVWLQRLLLYIRTFGLRIKQKILWRKS